jgi:S-adenosylmethionine-diacylglycerol 3-amino-3-carboxypropyl transferase
MTAEPMTVEPVAARVPRIHPLTSREGWSEMVFGLAFRGLVYSQIWEDPDVDMEALEISPTCDVVAIASGGCNILSYLTADPHRITALDLSEAHVALTRLKLAAARHLPSWKLFHRFFGNSNDPANIEVYGDLVAPHLDPATRRYWDSRPLHKFGRRRISVFARNVYRHGLLGRFIGLGHMVARLHGVRFDALLRARSLAEQRSFFENTLSPLFGKPLIRWAASRQLALYGLGIPPAQYGLLAPDANMAAVLRERVERLTCGFRLSENYFAWQAFGRGYDREAGGALPPYLMRENFPAVHARADRVEVLNQSFTDHLAGRPDQSVDRYVLLDAQDWMTDAQLNALWSEICRTARPGARVIFRTAGVETLLPGRVASALLDRWRYEADASRAWTLRDRSAIYGGFHLYVLER